VKVYFHLTLQEYEALEAATEDTRYEYIDGQLYAMSGGTIAHYTIIQNSLQSLRNHFRSVGCKSFSESVKLEIVPDKRYVYPDVMLTCSERDKASNRLIRDPRLIIEVLSDSTEGKDLREKVDIYQAIPTLQAYIIIDQYSCWVRVYERNGQGAWQLHPYLHSLEDTLQLPSLGWQLPLRELYTDVVVTQQEE
jgi:Uma2 family endonuclease